MAGFIFVHQSKECNLLSALPAKLMVNDFFHSVLIFLLDFAVDTSIIFNKEETLEKCRPSFRGGKVYQVLFSVVIFLLVCGCCFRSIVKARFYESKWVFLEDFSSASITPVEINGFVFLLAIALERVILDRSNQKVEMGICNEMKSKATN